MLVGAKACPSAGLSGQQQREEQRDAETREDLFAVEALPAGLGRWCLTSTRARRTQLMTVLELRFSPERCHGAGRVPAKLYAHVRVVRHASPDLRLSDGVCSTW